jgi:hypothetical protein
MMRASTSERRRLGDDGFAARGQAAEELVEPHALVFGKRLDVVDYDQRALNP